MPAKFELIHPDQSISFVEIAQQGEPCYIGFDAQGDMRLAPDGVLEPIAMIIEGEDGSLEARAFEPDRVRLDGAPLNGSQKIVSWSEIELEGHVFILLDEAGTSPAVLQPANLAIQAADASQIAAQGIQIQSVRFREFREELLVYDVIVQTSGGDQASEPEVELSAVVGRLKVEFTPLTAGQLELIDPAFNPKIFNARANGISHSELIIRSKPSYLLQAGTYKIYVKAEFSRSPRIYDENLEGSLEIKPFSKFRLSDPIPTQHSSLQVYSVQPAASVVSITNEGNATVHFKIEGRNEPGSDCASEFLMLPRDGKNNQPAKNGLADTRDLEAASQPKALKSLKIDPGDTRDVQVMLRPREQPWFSLKHARHTVVLAVSTDGIAEQTRSIRLSVAPILLGPRRLLCIIALLFGLVTLHVWQMNDRTRFAVISEAKASATALPCSTASARYVATPGATVTFQLCGAPFTDLKLEKLAVNATPEAIDIAGVPMTKTVSPAGSFTYRLTAYHPLGRLLPWPPFVVQRTFDIVQGEMDIPTGTWGVRPPQVLPNGEVTIFWNAIDRAKKLTLFENDIPHPIPVENIVLGQMKLSVSEPVTFTLVASNDFTSTQINSENKALSITVDVVAPDVTPTPLAPPAITRFEIAPAQISSGERILVTWEVTGPADGLTVTLISDGIASIVPASGAIFQQPISAGDTVRAYRLVADNGRTFVVMDKQVMVSAPTPTPTPTVLPTPTAGPVGTPNYDAFCGGAGRSELVEGRWRWVCKDNPQEDITDEACRILLNIDTAIGKAESPGDKGSWRCWNRKP